MTSPSKKNPSGKKDTPKKGKHKTTKELMKAHLKDKDHKITDEDIESLDLKLGHPKKAPRPPETIVPSTDDRPDEEKQRDDADNEKKITPWDVLGG